MLHVKCKCLLCNIFFLVFHSILLLLSYIMTYFENHQSGSLEKYPTNTKRSEDEAWWDFTAPVWS